MNRKIRRRQIVLVLATLGRAAVVTVVLFLTAPEPPQAQPGKPGVLVETRQLKPEKGFFHVSAQGTVRPVRSVDLVPQVTGRITWVSPTLKPGRMVNEGEKLVQIELADYEQAVEQAEAALTQARSDLALERGRRQVAEREWKYFQDRVSEAASAGERELALREPQLSAAKARVQEAESSLRMARLNLERTTITAPFDAAVSSETAAVGRLASPQIALATLVDRTKAWVEAAVPVSKLGVIAFPGRNSNEGSPATVRWDTGGPTTEFEARVIELLPGLTPQGRMAQVLLEIDQPFAMDNVRGSLPLLFDAYVDVTIRSEDRHQFTRVPRDAVHNGEEVHVLEDGALRIARPTIVWRDEESVLVSKGLQENARVIVSAISGPVEGMPLRTSGGVTAASGQQQPAAGSRPQPDTRAARTDG